MLNLSPKKTIPKPAKLADIACISEDIGQSIKIAVADGNLMSIPQLMRESTNGDDDEKVSSPSTTNKRDSVRREMLWTSKIESVIGEWHESCISMAKAHGEHAKYHKKVFYSLGIPSAVIPLTIAALNDILKDEYSGITIAFLIATGIITTVNGFLNPSKMAEDHSNFQAMYGELAVEITSELVKPRTYRQDADVFIQRIMDRYNSLNNRAPAT